MKLPDEVIEKDGVFTLVGEDPDGRVSTLMDKVHVRVPGERKWIRKKGVLEKAASFLKAVTSEWVSDEEYEKRRAQCYAPCPALKRIDGFDYCAICG